MVGACQIDQAAACVVVVRRPAYRGSRDVGGAVAVVDGAAEDVAAAVGAAAVGAAEGVGDVVDVAVGGAGRTDTCSDLSCGYPSQNAVLACKTGRARWNMRWQIATEDVGSTGPEMCGLACRRAARWQYPRRGGFKVVSSGGRYHQAGRQASVKGRRAGRHVGRLASWMAKSMSLSLLHANSRARRVRGGGSSSGRVGQERRDETSKPYGGQAGKQAGEQTTETRDRFLAVHSSSQVLGKV
jgi:hypothetical protein